MSYQLLGGATSAEVVTEGMSASAARAADIARAAASATLLSWGAGGLVSLPLPGALGAAAEEVERELATVRAQARGMVAAYTALALSLRWAASAYAAAERRALTLVGGAGWWNPGGGLGLAIYVKSLAMHRPLGIQGTVRAIGGLGSLAPGSLGGYAAANPGLLVDSSMHTLGVAAPPPPILTEAAQAEDARSPSDLKGLLELQDQAARGPGALLVTRVDGPGGPTWVLTVPSTNMAPRSAWGLHRLVDAMRGNTDTVAPAALAALRAAGAKKGEPVVLNGHSQGGRHALNLAGSELLRRQYKVTGAFTAGAPAGKQLVPGDVPVLSLEDVDDTVPGMDGRVEVPVGRNRLLVRSTQAPTPDNQGDPGFFGYEHRVGTYQVIAAEAKDHPEVSSMVASWGLAGRATTYRVPTTSDIPRVSAARGRAGGMKLGQEAERNKYGK